LLANGFGLGKPIDIAALVAAPWIGLPKFARPSFRADAMFLIAPVAVILVCENLGHLKAIGAIILLGFSPKFGALIQSIPGPVLGGLFDCAAWVDSCHGWLNLAREQGRLLQPKKFDHRRCGAYGRRWRPKFGAFTVGRIGTATFGAIIL
jgi:hypothetical protein